MGFKLQYKSCVSLEYTTLATTKIYIAQTRSAPLPARMARRLLLARPPALAPLISPKLYRPLDVFLTGGVYSYLDCRTCPNRHSTSEQQQLLISYAP